MKKILLISISILLCLSFTACGKKEEPAESGNEGSLVIVSDGEKKETHEVKPSPFDEEVDIDISQMSGTVVYSTVYDMMWNPQNYVGKTIRVTGIFVLGEDYKGRKLYGCLVPDATACCQQGIEFVLKGDRVYPDDYPELDKWIILQGEFTYTDEDMIRNIALINAEVKESDNQGYVN